VVAVWLARESAAQVVAGAMMLRKRLIALKVKVGRRHRQEGCHARNQGACQLHEDLFMPACWQVRSAGWMAYLWIHRYLCSIIEH
jgi:hypothetical protein